MDTVVDPRVVGPRRRRGIRNAVVAGFAVATLALTGCTTIGGGGGSETVTSSGSVRRDSAADAAIREIVDGRELKVGFAPPILSEWYTQVEKAAFNKMKEYEERF